jgi:hypothetical protein
MSHPRITIEDDLDRPLWGAEEIGAEIKKSVKATFHLLAHGRIPATKVGKQWVTTKRRLRDHFAGREAAVG